MQHRLGRFVPRRISALFARARSADAEAGSSKMSGASFRIILVLGMVSLFGDMVYEGARGVTGPYLATMGATGTAIGFIAGFAEMLGYAIRMGSGRVSRDPRFIWPSIAIGYLMTVVAVPVLTFANSMVAGAALICTERLGKGVRTPARDVVLSETAGAQNRGFAFGFHEAFDQIGGVVGPLMVAAILYFTGSYQLAFAWLAIPGALTMLCLFGAWLLVRRQRRAQAAEAEETAEAQASVQEEQDAPTKFPAMFWLCCTSYAFIAAGFVSFALIAFGMQSTAHWSASFIPLMYAVAQTAEGLFAVPLGRLYDRKGIVLVRATAFACAPLALLVFSDSSVMICLGVVLWGIAMVLQLSLAKAVVAEMIPHRELHNAAGQTG
jgi:hypothetical protein